MTLVRKAVQFRQFIAGIEAGGGRVVSHSPLRTHPVALSVVLSNGSTFRALAYSWNITPGGPPRNPSERRVQATGAPIPQLYPTGQPPPLLLGYHAELDVFAAWDATKHRYLGGASNSLYIPLATLQEAKRVGFAPHKRLVAANTEEVVVAFRPQVADHYLRLAVALRPRGRANVAATAAAARGRTPGKVPLSQMRKKVLRTVAQVARDARFRGEVLNAYGDACAFCGLGAKLVEAAHIKSVKRRGPDDVTNGIAACPTHHRAFDLGYMLIDDDYSITINGGKTSLLDQREVRKFARSLRPKLVLPSDADLRPDLRFVRFRRKEFG